ncbi:MAG TPA: tetratricopeptide repeat protein, partial [Candidatus Limnocylindrales bacterium]|nr:tetratricopeptide repeat protein [Candidatus Limnocylindrales bacterium]
HPHDTPSVMLLMALYDETAQYDLAISMLEAAVKANPRQPLFGVALGRMLVKTGRYDPAVTLLSDLITKTPDLVVARAVRGQAYLAKGDGVAAVRDFTEVARADPDSATTRQYLARAIAVAGKGQEAQAAVRDALKVDPVLARAVPPSEGSARPAPGKSADPAAGLGAAEPGSILRREATVRALLARGQVAQAQKEAQQLLEQAAGHPEGNVLMAEILERLNRADEAAELLRTALRTNPSHTEANLRLARYLLRYAQREEALQRVRTAIKSNAGLSNLFPILGHVPNALAFSRDLEKAEPQNGAAAALTGWILFSQGNPKAAIPAFQRAGAVKPDHQEAHRGLGEAYQATGDPDRAIESYRRAVALDDADVSALNNLAWLLADAKNRPDEALPFASRAVTLAPRWGDVMDTLGWVHYRRAAYPEAAKVFARAAELSPKNAVIHYHLGMAYARMGKKPEAVVSLRRALEVGRGIKPNEKVVELLKELGG